MCAWMLVLVRCVASASCQVVLYAICEMLLCHSTRMMRCSSLRNTVSGRRSMPLQQGLYSLVHACSWRAVSRAHLRKGDVWQFSFLV